MEAELVTRDPSTHVSDQLEAELLDFEAARARRAPAPDDPDTGRDFDDGGAPDRQDARGLARRYIGARATHRDGVTIRRWRGDWYRWTAESGCYRGLTDERMDVELYSTLPIGKRSDVGEVRLALMAVDGVLIDEIDLGAWLGGDAPNSLGMLETVACRNGLVHLPTGRVTPATPRFFTTTALPHVYDLKAPTPTRWLAFLRQLWPHDEDSIGFLQEWMGYLLTPDTRQHKIAWLIGKPRSGKGTIGRVISALLGGDANVAGPTLGQFATEFGLQSLVGKLAAIIPDARLGARVDAGQIVERLLMISGADPQNVNRKNRDFWYGVLPARIMIISNEIPRLTDASPALATRSIMLKLSESFLGKEDTELATKLTEELPGILLWAIDGWRRLQARGRFDPPAASIKQARQLADNASLVGAWVRERCVTDEANRDLWIQPEDAYADFKSWCSANGQQHIPTLTRFGLDVDVAAGCERIRPAAKFPGAPRPRVYRGLRFKTRDEIEQEEDADDI